MTRISLIRINSFLQLIFLSVLKKINAKVKDQFLIKFREWSSCGFGLQCSLASFTKHKAIFFWFVRQDTAVRENLDPANCRFFEVLSTTLKKEYINMVDYSVWDHIEVRRPLL